MLPFPVPSLYVHVPFCAQKCSYCAFYSEPSHGKVISRYVEALFRELELVAPRLKPRTVFFGGGTPSLLSIAQWEKIFAAMDGLKLLGAEEWTIECNPATVSEDKARLWRSHGVNRISMGVQSLDEALLDRLGRIHSREMVFKSYDVLRKAGFENVNIDLMFGIPGQAMGQWNATLDEAFGMKPEHISCYEVIYEEDTPLYTELCGGRIVVDEELGCEMYERLLERSQAEGFHQYEVANFARHKAGVVEDVPDYACRHNIHYWRGGAYFGLGPSAAGYVDGARTKNWSNTVLYCEQLEKGMRAIESTENLDPLRRAGETAAFGLRMNYGWPFIDFERTTGFDLRHDWKDEMEELIQRDWAVRDQSRFFLTSTGMRFADAAAEVVLK